MHRPGGTSSYYTIPSEALRQEVGESSAYYGVPTDEPAPGFAPDVDPGRRRRPAPAPQDGFPLDGEAPRNGFAPEPDLPRRNGRRRAGEQSAHLPAMDVDGPRRNGHRADEASAHLPTDFAPDADRRNGHRAGEASAHLPADFAAESPHRNGRRAGEASAHLPADFAPEADPRRNGRRPGEASAHLPTDFAPEADARRNGRRAGEASAHIPADFAPEPGGRHNGRRAGEASAHLPADFAPEAASAHLPTDFAPEADSPRRNGRRAGEASTHLPVPGRNGRRPGEASAHLPADGFAPEAELPRRGRRPGEASVQLPTDFPQDAPNGRRRIDEAFGPGARRVGETSGLHGVPGNNGFDEPRRRMGDGPFPGERPGEFDDSRRMPGRPGEGSGPRNFQPEPGRPQGAARRRAARAALPPPADLAPGGPFPQDAPPQPGQGSGRFPVDRQGRPLPAPADPVSEPRLTPAAIDAPDKPRPTRSTGVPPVPLPPPRHDDDPISMTTEMQAIGDELHDEVQKRRSIDHTLARFSAVHDEIKAEEREKKAKRRKLRPWERDDEMDRLDELDAQQSMAMAIPVIEPDEDEEEQEKKAKKKRRWLKGKNAGKAFTIVIAALIFGSSAAAWGFKAYFESNTQTVDALDPDSAAIKDASAQLGDENFLLVGSDTRAGATAEDGVGDDKTVEGARSDTVMIAHIPKNRERVVVVSFPRDLEVTRPACEGWDSRTGQLNGVQHPAAKQVKLNTAYQVGGPKCVTKLVQELSGLAVNHFVGIDFHGFKDMVDAVQGVEVCVERPMVDETLGMIIPEAGKNVKISGDQALNFVRARKVQGDKTSDYGRIQRQQRFLSSLLRKAMSSEVLLSPSKLTKFVKAFSSSTFGDNIGIDQLMMLGQSMQNMQAGGVTFITIPTVGIANKRGNEDLRAKDANALFEAIRQNTPLPGETPAKQQPQQKSGLKQQPTQTQPAGPVDPKTVKIQVLNGGNETGGIARTTSEKLANFGFQIVRYDSTAPVDKTVVKYSKGNEAAAQTVQAAVPGATLQEDPSMGGAIQLVLGPEFNGKVQSPTGGGAPAELPENLSTVNAGDVSCA